MDLWDLTRLLFKRWYATVPMLLLTIGGGVWTITSVEPDYIATAHVQLLPPATTLQAPINTAKTPTLTPRNPWLDIGLGSIGNATAVTLQDKSFIKQMEAARLSDTFTITMENQVPLVTIEVVGHSPAQAKNTVEFLTKAFDQNIATLQNSYGAPKTEKISTRRLDMGDNVSTSSSKVKRTLVAIVGAGLLLTVALAVSLDAFLRRRARKRSEAATAAAPPIPVRPVPDPPVSDASSLEPGRSNDSVAAAALSARPATGEDAEPGRTMNVRQLIGPTPYGAGPPNGSAVAGDEPKNGNHAGRKASPGESTIVLPNPHGSVYRRRDDDQDRE